MTEPPAAQDHDENWKSWDHFSLLRLQQRVDQRSPGSRDLTREPSGKSSPSLWFLQYLREAAERRRMMPPFTVQYPSDIDGPAGDKNDLGRDVMDALRGREPIFYAAPRSPEELQRLVDLNLSGSDIELIRSLPPGAFAVRWGALSPVERLAPSHVASNSRPVATVVLTHRVRSDEPVRLDGTVNPFDPGPPPNNP